MMEHIISAVMRRSMRRTFRRVVLAPDWVTPDPSRPVVLYANHHYHHDRFLLRLASRRLERRTITWMQE